MALVFDGVRMRLEREHQGRAWLAWHTAAMPQMKKFPALDKLMGVKRETRRQTVSEIEAVLMAWAARG